MATLGKVVSVSEFPVALMLSWSLGTVALAGEPAITAPGSSQDNVARAQTYLKGLVTEAHKKSFADFKADPGAIDLELAAPVIGKITPEQLVDVQNRLAALTQSLAVVATVQVPTPGSSDVVAFDCAIASTQPANKSEKTEHPPGERGVVNDAKPSVAPPVSAAVPENGPATFFMANTDAACPKGTVALKRNSLPEALQQLGSKHVQPAVDLDGLRLLLGQQLPQGLLPQAPVPIHRYAHAGAQIKNYGAEAVLNVWSPRVVDGDMSLSQIWVVAGDPNFKTLQTVEAGWQVMNLWNTPFSAFFVYSTSDNYNTTGCYVTKCQEVNARPETFVIYTNKILIAAPIAPQSSSGGTQAELEIKWSRNSATGSWWLKVDGDWIGYYPQTVFGTGPLSHYAEVVDFGGEATGIDATSEMGSGSFPSAGKGKAAYQRSIRYFEADGAEKKPTLIPRSTDQSCYDVAVNSGTPPAVPNEIFFYFGGPGVRHFTVPPGAACTAPTS